MIIMIDGNDADLRLRDLRTLNVVLRERNLTRAAQILGTTQPSVSKVLARLRMHFGDPLVIRNGNARDGHPVQLPPRAAEMADPLRNLLSRPMVFAHPRRRSTPAPRIAPLRCWSPMLARSSSSPRS